MSCVSGQVFLHPRLSSDSISSKTQDDKSEKKVNVESGPPRLIDLHTVFHLRPNLHHNSPGRAYGPLIAYHIKGFGNCNAEISVRTYDAPEHPLAPWISVKVKHVSYTCTCNPCDFKEMNWRLELKSPFNRQLEALEALPVKFWVGPDVMGWEEQQNKDRLEICQFVWIRVLAWILSIKKAFRISVPESLNQIDMTVWKHPHSGENIIHLAEFMGCYDPDTE